MNILLIAHRQGHLHLQGHPRHSAPLLGLRQGHVERNLLPAPRGRRQPQAHDGGHRGQPPTDGRAHAEALKDHGHQSHDRSQGEQGKDPGQEGNLPLVCHRCVCHHHGPPQDRGPQSTGKFPLPALPRLPEEFHGEERVRLSPSVRAAFEEHDQARRHRAGKGLRQYLQLQADDQGRNHGRNRRLDQEAGRGDEEPLGRERPQLHPGRLRRSQVHRDVLCPTRERLLLPPVQDVPELRRGGHAYEEQGPLQQV